MTQIWKRNWEGASKVAAGIRITRWHTWERFWSGGYEQLHMAPVSQALLGIGQQEAQACFNNACRSGGGRILALRERRVVKYRHFHLRSVRAQWTPSWKRTRLRAACLSSPHVPVLCCMAGCGGWTQTARLACCLGPAWPLLLPCHLWPAEQKEDKIRKISLTFLFIFFNKRKF